MSAEKDGNVRALLAGDARPAQAWLRTVNLKSISAATDAEYNWLAIASGAATNSAMAALKGADAEAEAWAVVAIQN